MNQDFSFKNETLAAINRIGFKELTAIQETAIPLILEGKDIVAKSATGSGKTHAYLLPLFDRIHMTKRKVLILAPTKILAHQIFMMAKDLKYPAINLVLLSGGLDKEKSLKDLAKAQIIVATLGRIWDVLTNDSQAFDLKSINHIVLDEVDMMLDDGFRQEIQSLIKATNHNRQVVAFSASIDKGLRKFLLANLKKPQIIELSETINSTQTINYLIPYRDDDYVKYLVAALESVKPLIGLIFASSIEKTEAIHNGLISRGLNVALLHSKLTNRQREITIKRIRNKEFQFAVCSDIMSRGIDIEGVTHVFSIDFPREIEYYYHRLGRTGRHLLDGFTYTFYDRSERHKVLEISKKIQFIHGEFINGQFHQLRPLLASSKGKKNVVLENKIRAVYAKKSNKVKPNYKKKLRAEAEKVKKEHKKEIIRANLKKKHQQAKAEAGLRNDL